MGSRGRENILGKGHIGEKRGEEGNGPTGELELGYTGITVKNSGRRIFLLTMT